MHVIKGGIKIGKGIDNKEFMKKLLDSGVELPIKSIASKKPIASSKIVMAPQEKKEELGYSKKELDTMKMSEIRKIGDKYSVKDNIKSELIEKILKAVN